METLESRALLAGGFGDLSIDLGAVNHGIQVADNADGAGYIMYSAEEVATRFADQPPHHRNSDHLIAVRHREGYWEYNPDSPQWYRFEPAENDRLLAAVDYSRDLIASLQGSSGQVHGIHQGFSSGDLSFVADQWNGRFNNGEFTVAGTSFQIDTDSLIGTSGFPLGEIDRGIQVADGTTGTGYIMYSYSDVAERFGANPPHERNSEHVIAVRYHNDQWQYGTQRRWHAFETEVHDRLLAAVDFDLDRITSLRGASGALHGIEHGYSDGDLLFHANVWGGRYDAGEFTVTGSTFRANQTPTSAVGPIGRGVQVAENASGNGFIMYSFVDVFDRFESYPPSNNNSHHLIAVRNAGNGWQYNDGSQWRGFVPSNFDRLIASVDFDLDIIKSLAGTAGSWRDLAYGYSAGDVSYVADQWNGEYNNGEFTAEGSWLQFDATPRYRIGEIGNGIQVADNASGPGYIMHSAENIFERFVAQPPHPRNSAHLIAVKFFNGRWKYNDGQRWWSFNPNGHDRLIAAVDYSLDTVVGLQGATGSVQGIEQGYAEGDLTFQADVWSGRFNNGEFTVAGTSYQVGAITGTLLGAVDRGIQVADNAMGAGYILHSFNSVHERFAANPPHSRNSEHLVAVRHHNEAWQYNDGSSWRVFTPQANDRLIAAVDYSADTIIALEGIPGQVHGIRQGYAAGNLRTFSNQWNGRSNQGEFTVTGNWFTDAPLTIGPANRSSAGTTNFDWISVGNPNNPANTKPKYGDGSTGYGSVAYAFLLSEFEVTNAQYTQFLNAVAKTDLYGLFTDQMQTRVDGGIIRTGSPGNYTYRTKPHFHNKPVNYVSFYDGARFANWLHNGQRLDPATAEYGAYTFSGRNTVSDRNPDAKIYIPNEHEWQKAGFYQPGAVTNLGDGWWRRFAAQDNRGPTTAIVNSTGDVINPSPYTTVRLKQSNWNGSVLGNVATVGSAGSKSFYGAYDMAGNVFEWVEADPTKPDPNGWGPYMVLGGSFRNEGHFDLMERNLAHHSNHNLTSSFVGLRLAASL